MLISLSLLLSSLALSLSLPSRSSAAEPAQKPLVIAHRGASAFAPENTMASFKKAFELGADMIELDIHLSSDGELIVMHDPDTKRTTGTANLISLMKTADIKKLDAGSWMDAKFAGEKVPTLPEVLEWAKGKIAVNIEIKSGGCEEKTVKLVEKLGMVDKVIVSSFNHEYLKKIKELNKDIKTAALVKDFSGKADLKNIIEDCAPDAVNPRFLTLTKKAVDQAHAAGLKVYPYTVDDPVSMKRMLSAGVDGIITNHTDLLLDVVKSGGGGK